MRIKHNLPVNDLTIMQIAQKVGANADIRIQYIDSLLTDEDYEGQALGDTRDNGNKKYTIRIASNEAHEAHENSIFHTLVHELVHVRQSVNGEKMDCFEADRIAIELMGV